MENSQNSTGQDKKPAQKKYRKPRKFNNTEPGKAAQNVFNTYVDKFDAPEQMITEMCRTYSVSKEHANKVFTEYKKFMFIKSRQSVAIASLGVNRMWRLHFLHTQSYIDFCKVLRTPLINFEISHTYIDGSQFYKYTLDEYRRLFGEPDSSIWHDDYRMNQDVVVDSNRMLVIKKFWKK